MPCHAAMIEPVTVLSPFRYMRLFFIHINISLPKPPYPKYVKRDFMSVFFRLIRVKLSLAVAFSILPVFVLAARALDWRAATTFLGVFLLAAAASAFNQVQERERDALMARTADRPLPAGRLRPKTALITAAALGTAGFFILLFGAGLVPALIGAGTLFWYNFVYTPLKTKTRWALFIGALTGAAPPAIGWTAAGGLFSDPALYAVALFMFLWQVPHFLLLALVFSGEYKAAGIRCFLTGATQRRGRAAIGLWAIGTAISTIPFFALGIAASPIPGAVIAVSGSGIVGYFLLVLFYAGAFNFRFAFHALYVYQLFVLTGIALQGLWG
jgi:protoheme IX farnesyltransferase